MIELLFFYSSFFWFFFGDFLNNSDSNCLFHISDGKSSERGILSKGFNAHGFGGVHNNNSRFILLNEFGFNFNRLSSSLINFINKSGEFASNMSSMTIKNWSVSSVDLTRMVHNDNLRFETLGFSGGVLFIIRGNVSSSDIFNRETFHVETYVITRFRLG